MKNLAQAIGFQAKENAKDIFIKKYQDDYVIEIDFDFDNSIHNNIKTSVVTNSKNIL